MPRAWKRRLAGVVWVVGVVAAAGWSGLERGGVEARGIGYAPPVHVSAVEPGQLADLAVTLHDPVAAGQWLGQLDPGPLVEEREVVSARLLAAQEDQAIFALTEARRFAQGLEGSMLDRATVATDLIEDRALLDAVREQLAIEQDLLEHGATATQSVVDLQRQARVLEARIAAGQEALQVADSAADAALARATSAPGANVWEVVGVARELEALDARIERLQLASAIDGVVTAVYHTAGEVLAPGDPVVQIQRRTTDEVVAWVPASATGRVQPGQPARVVRANGEVLDAETVSVGVGLQPLPLSLLYDPQRVEFGVPVRARLKGQEIAPDEPVVLQL